MTPRKLTHDERGDTIGGVSLVLIAFDNNSLVHLGAMAFLVFCLVVRMHCMRHVHRENKTTTSCRISEIIREGATCRGCCYATYCLTHYWTTRSDCRVRANLLMVKQCNEAYIYIILDASLVRSIINECLSRNEASSKVIEAS